MPNTIGSILSQARCTNELKLSAFVSLLNSAQALGLEDPLLPVPEPNLCRFLSSFVNFDVTDHSHQRCSFPSLSIRNEQIYPFSAEKGMNAREAAAFSLAFPVFLDYDDVNTAPPTLLENISGSFMSLVQSRMKSSKNALLQDIIKRGASPESKFLLKLLSGKISSATPVSLNASVTTFRTLGATSESQIDEVSLPLIFESKYDLLAFGATMTVTTQAPGTVIGVFNQSDGGLERVEISLDTVLLLESLMKQAKTVVNKVIARAAGITHKMITKHSPGPSTLSSKEDRNGYSKDYGTEYHDSSETYQEHNEPTQHLEMLPPPVTSDGKVLCINKSMKVPSIKGKMHRTLSQELYNELYSMLTQEKKNSDQGSKRRRSNDMSYDSDNNVNQGSKRAKFV